MNEILDFFLEDVQPDRISQVRTEYTYQLCKAIARDKDNQGIEIMLAKRHSGNAVSPRDLVAAAAIVGDMKKVQHLISHGQDAHECHRSDLFGSALQLTAYRGNQKLLMEMMSRNSAHVRESFFENAFHGGLVDACYAKYTHILEYMLSFQPRPKTSTSVFGNAYRICASNGNDKAMERLGDFIHAKDKPDLLKRALSRASRLGNVTAVATLLDQGAEMNYHEPYGGPLHTACLYGRTEVVDLLLTRGAEHHKAQMVGDPMYFAMINGHVDVAQLLVKRGYSVHTQGYTSNGFVKAAKNGELGMIRWLSENGIDVNNESKYGIKALEEAAGTGEEEVIKFLVLTKGVDIDGVHANGDPPILMAMIRGQDHTVKLLSDLGAKMVDPLESDWKEEWEEGLVPDGDDLIP